MASDLKIVSVNDSVLVVKPVSDFSKTYFQDRPIISLKRKEFIVDKTLVFERLASHDSQFLPHASRWD
jgi:hypothetical protein